MAGNILAKSMATKLIVSRRGAPVEERTFDDEIITIGSDPAATLHLDDPAVASEQAIIIKEDGQLLLINRAAGTLLNGEPLAREARRTLAAGDQMGVGSYALGVSHAEGDEDAAEPVGQSERDAPAPPRDRDPGAPRVDEGRAPDAAGQTRQQERSFAAILDSLRTEEDSFYFMIESGGERRRVRIEAAEMMIGWDETGRRVSCEAGQVVAARAVVRKDWSGVVVLPLSAGMVSVNGETVEAPRRLRDGDRLVLLPAGVAGDPADDGLVFHEPASLVVLDTLLPQQQLPPPVTQAVAGPVAEEAAALAPRPRAGGDGRVGLFSPERRYFGYFTPTEVLIMIVGTLVTAVIIFMILEYA